MSRPESPSSPGPSTVSPSKPAAKLPTKGVSVFPTARVSRIIKADRDVDICSKEATFLISIATEIFIKKLTDEAYTNAKLDKRKHIFYKDLSRAVQNTEYLEFLKDVIPTPVALSAALEARQSKLAQKQTEENMILEGTLHDEDEEEEQEQDDEEEEQEAEDEEEQDAGEQQEADDQEEAQPPAAASTATAASDEEHAAPSKPSKKKSPSKKKTKSKDLFEPVDTHAQQEPMDEDAA